MHFTDGEFDRLVSYVETRYGIDLRKKRTLAECRLGLEMAKQGIDTLSAFLDGIGADRTGRLEAALMNRLTTNYTFFMREDSHFTFLTDQILPEVSGRADCFRAWSAGCASGEEAYTLAMTLLDAAQRQPLPRCEILATDISEAALEKAKAAKYPIRALERLPERWRQSYCRQEGEMFYLREQVKRLVTFQKMNLMTPCAGQERYDLILCRNVMIYFGEEARRRLAERLYASLKHGGYLFVGHTELLTRDEQRFAYICPAIYRKA